MKNDKLRLSPGQVALHPLPGGIKVGISCAGRYRDIQLCAPGATLAGFSGGACAGIEKAAFFVQVGEDQLRILFKGVEDAVAVVGVDIDIGDAANAVLPAQRLVDAPDRRRVALVEVTLARSRRLDDALDISRGVKQFDGGSLCGNRPADSAAPLQPAGQEFIVEGAEACRTSVLSFRP